MQNNLKGVILHGIVQKEKLAQKIAFLKERIKSDTAELNEAQAKYTELRFLPMKGSSNCDEQELDGVIVQELSLGQTTYRQELSKTHRQQDRVQGLS